MREEDVPAGGERKEEDKYFEKRQRGRWRAPEGV